MTEKLYVVDTWCDLDDAGQHYIEPYLYRTREAAERRAERVRSEVVCGIRYYAAVYEYEVVGE